MIKRTPIKQRIGICKCGGLTCGRKTIGPLIAGMSQTCYWESRRKETLQYIKSKPLQKIKKRSKIKPVSDKEKVRLAQYHLQRPPYLLANTLCLAKLDGCTIKSCDVHHTCGRRGKNLLDESTWLPVCRHCHDFIHEHSKEARQMGLLK